MKRHIYIITIAVYLITASESVYAVSTTASYLDVELRSMSDGTVSSSSEISFSNGGTATGDSPWILADQYLKIEFESHHDSSYWGLRIITNNVDDITGADGTEPPLVYDETGTIKYYNGLIYVTLDSSNNITSVSQDPNYRITLAWQVYDVNMATLTSGRKTITGRENIKIYIIWYAEKMSQHPLFWNYILNQKQEKKPLLLSTADLIRRQ